MSSQSDDDRDLPGKTDLHDDDLPGDTAGAEGSRRLGTWMFVRGVWGAAFGLATVFWPRVELTGMTDLSVTVGTADMLLLAYLLGSAVLLVLQGLSLRKVPTDDASGAGLLTTAVWGQAVVTLPGIVFLFLADVPGELRAAIAVWAFLHGLVELWVWAQQKGRRMRSDFLITGVLHAALGVIIFVSTSMGALTVLGSTGAVVTIGAVLYMLGGYSRRSRR
ncbi:hypothetical protein [Brevibacterium litoralis]|uniref:hypothetical protein n=1 Tax=Brevibacterium litoralis TaxID=3138935 RepID=UPI0032EDCC0E